MKPTFSSRWALILAALGMAIGTGNVWRFPRILAQNGGGTFLIPWAIFLFTWSVPLLMVEFAIGRSSRKGPMGAFASVFGRGTAWRGGFVAFCTLAILFYYSVVSGWTMRYLGMAVSGGFADLDPGQAEQTFVSFTEGAGPAFTHLLSIGLACLVVAGGVTRGIERACNILVPSLFVVLILCAVRGLTLDGADAGLSFLFSVEPERLTDYKVWLEALSQSAWSTGAGWGLMVCYAIYANGSMRAGRECLTTGVGNNCASLLAALAILPAVFALVTLADPGADPTAVVQQSGPASTGLTFIWMPVLFQQMPGGGVLGGLFFLGLAFAALSSLIAMVELAVRTLIDLGFTRRRATAATFVVGFLLGLPSAIDLGFIPGHKGLSFFSNQDWVWGVGLIVSGGLLGFSVLRYGAGRFWTEQIAAHEQGGRGRGVWFRLALGVLVPIQAVGLLAWWFWQAWTWTAAEGRTLGERFAEWLDPMALSSVGTCLAQWAIVIAVLIFTNRKLAARVMRDVD